MTRRLSKVGIEGNFLIQKKNVYKGLVLTSYDMVKEYRLEERSRTR